MRRTKSEKACLEHIVLARMAVPDYGCGRPVSSSQVGALRQLFRIDVRRVDMGVPVLTSPPISGRHYMLVRPDIPASIVDFFSLHEISHLVAGEANELTWVSFTGPLPEMEDRCDVFALIGLLDEVVIDSGEAAVEKAILELVPLEVPGWRGRRVPRLAGQVVRMQELRRTWLDGFSLP